MPMFSTIAQKSIDSDHHCEEDLESVNIQPISKTVCEGNGNLDVGEYELAFWDLKYIREVTPPPIVAPHTCSSHLMSYLRPICVPLAIVLILSSSILFISLLEQREAADDIASTKCNQPCLYEIVETIPENLTYPSKDVIFPSIYSAWADLLDKAETSVDVAAFCWTLRNDDVTPEPIKSSWMGEDIFKRFNTTGLRKDLKMRIAQNSASKVSPQKDSALLKKWGAAEVRNVNFNKLVGAGVLHTKMWIIDDKHLYLGSANMDWRSLAQVKEVGVVIRNCPCLANDLKKIFEVYWYLGTPDAIIPPKWPAKYDTIYNADNQVAIAFSNSDVTSYLSSSPPSFTPDGRTNDIDAIVDIINKAQKFVYIAVMDYFPRLLYSDKGHKFWPIIDDALRRAALERGVTVHLLGSHWNHTRPDMAHWLQSLQTLSNSYTHIDIQTKLFVVPATDEQRRIPFGRVNHNKYMVTDNTAYIGTSNWSGDYFINTGGIGLVINETDTGPSVTYTLRSQLQQLFERDWNSEYAHDIDPFLRNDTQSSKKPYEIDPLLQYQ